MSTTIDRDSFNRARSLLDEGQVSEAWQVLGDAGDNYARNAAIITGDDDSQRSKILVRETWENTVGEDLYNEKFDLVAQRHLDNYLIAIAEINSSAREGGLLTLPSTTQIENSYQDALQRNGVPLTAAIDGIINTAVDGTPIPGWTSWLDLFDGKWDDDYDIEDERVTDTVLDSGYSRFEAISKLVRIGAETTDTYYADGRIASSFEHVMDTIEDLYGETRDFFGSLFSNQIEDQQSNIPSSQINNSLLDLNINTDLDSNFRPTSNPTQTGNAIDGGDYYIESDISVLNGDGAQNTTPMGILTDQYRPGNVELSTSEGFAREVAENIVLLNQGQGHDVLADLTNQAIDAQSFVNIDPVILDLNNNNRIDLISYQDSQVTFDG